jgi:predicted transcriptional regulator
MEDSSVIECVHMENATKRRDRHEIMAEILDTAKEAKIKTHIMYKAKLSYAQLYEYLDLLVEEGFLENVPIRRKKQILTMYKTTQKGMEFLHHMESVDKLFE